MHFFVVGNKNDLYDREQVPKNEAMEYAKSINAIYRCVSALETNGGINELFETLGNNLMLNKTNDPSEEENNKNTIILNSKSTNKNNKKKKKKCC